MRHSLLFISCIALVGIFAWWKYVPGEIQTSPSPETTRSGAAPYADGSVTASQFQSAPVTSDRLPNSALPLSDQEMQMAQTRQREDERKSVQDIVATGDRKLRDLYQMETTNQKWAAAKQLELEKFVVVPQMEAINAIPTEFDVRCRSSMCRIVADFPSRTAADDWSTLYMTNNGGLLPRASLNTTAQADGSVRLEILGTTM